MTKFRKHQEKDNKNEENGIKDKFLPYNSVFKQSLKYPKKLLQNDSSLKDNQIFTVSLKDTMTNIYSQQKLDQKKIVKIES